MEKIAKGLPLPQFDTREVHVSCNVLQWVVGCSPQDSHGALPPGDAGYRQAWDMAIEEYNSYGLGKNKIDKSTANLFFGFKAHQQGPSDKDFHGQGLLGPTSG